MPPRRLVNRARRAAHWGLWLLYAVCATGLEAQTATPTPAAPAGNTPSDVATSPLGIPSSIWVTLILGAGGYAVIGKGLGTIFNSGVAFVQALSENAPRRMQADLERDGVETLNLKQEAEFLAQMNAALKQQNDINATLQTAIADLHRTDAEKSTIITGMHANGLKQADLITQMQIAFFQRDQDHQAEIGRLNGRITEMETSAVSRETQLIRERDEWKDKYEREHARAEALQERLNTITGEHAVVSAETPIQTESAPEPPAPPLA